LLRKSKTLTKKEIKTMKKLNRILIIAIVSGIALMAVNMILAQEEEQPPQPPQQGQQQRQQQRQQFDPQQMMERRMQQIIEQMKLSEDETTVLKPMIKNLMNMRMEQSRESRTLLDNLQKAINAKDETQIKTALDAVKSKRNEQKATTEKAEKELMDLLTVVQEANLTIMGVVNSDGMGMVMARPGGPGGPGQNPQRGGSRQPQGQRN